MDTHSGANYLGWYYDGTLSRPLMPAEIESRSIELEISMPDHEADDILNNVASEILFGSKLEFIQYIAVLCSRYAKEIRRKTPGPNKEIYRIL